MYKGINPRPCRISEITSKTVAYTGQHHCAQASRKLETLHMSSSAFPDSDPICWNSAFSARLHVACLDSSNGVIVSVEESPLYFSLLSLSVNRSQGGATANFKRRTNCFSRAMVPSVACVTSAVVYFRVTNVLEADSPWVRCSHQPHLPICQVCSGRRTGCRTGQLYSTCLSFHAHHSPTAELFIFISCTPSLTGFFTTAFG